MHADSDAPDRSKLITWLLVSCVGLPVFYFLSTGPIALFTERTPGMMNPTTLRAIQFFYAPLIWLDQHPLFHQWIKAYLNLWGAH